MDPEAASAAALEAILNATKAASRGNIDAGNALQSLSSAAAHGLSVVRRDQADGGTEGANEGEGVEGKEEEKGDGKGAERAGLLMEVLQQVCL